jgi:hypothetical protein
MRRKFTYKVKLEVKDIDFPRSIREAYDQCRAEGTEERPYGGIHYYERQWFAQQQEFANLCECMREMLLTSDPSNSPSEEDFEHWLSHEFLPEIERNERKKGFAGFIINVNWGYSSLRVTITKTF